VLVEGAARKDPNEFAGRTDNNRMVNFAGKEDVLGSFVELRITEARSHSLRGELLPA
jgi:tRNA-2-methylthio-N6-dimethylallyladenosine synthase